MSWCLAALTQEFTELADCLLEILIRDPRHDQFRASPVGSHVLGAAARRNREWVMCDLYVVLRLFPWDTSRYRADLR